MDDHHHASLLPGGPRGEETEAGTPSVPSKSRRFGIHGKAVSIGAIIKQAAFNCGQTRLRVTTPHPCDGRTIPNVAAKIPRCDLSDGDPLIPLSSPPPVDWRPTGSVSQVWCLPDSADSLRSRLFHPLLVSAATLRRLCLLSEGFHFENERFSSVFGCDSPHDSIMEWLWSKIN